MTTEPQVNYCIEGTHDEIRRQVRADLIEPLRALSEAATPGPWDAPMGFAPETRTVPNATDIHAVRADGPNWPGFFLGAVESKADAAFIAAAVNVIRSLLRDDKEAGGG